MIVNKEPYPLSFEMQISQAIVCRYGEEFRQYKLKPDIDVSGLSCLLQIAKPDGTFTENDVEVVTEEDECYLILTIPKQATVVKGVAKYSVCCYGEVETETHLLYSAEGPLWIDDALITEEMIESVAEVNGYRFPQDFLTLDMIPNLVDTIIHTIINDDEISDHSTWSASKINGLIEGIEDEISGLTVDIIYSLDEQKIGKWINGKDLYKKTIEQTSGFSTSYSLNHGIADIDEIVNVEGFFRSTNAGYTYRLNDNVPVSGYYTCISDIGRTSITVYIGGSRLSSIAALQLTFYYTKL